MDLEGYTKSVGYSSFKEEGVMSATSLGTIVKKSVGWSIGLSVLWLGSRLQSSPAAIAGVVISLLVMAVGIVITAHQAPQAPRSQDERVVTTAGAEAGDRPGDGIRPREG